MPDDEAYMRLALEQARLAAAMGEVPVGAVLVHGGEVIAAAHNLVEARKLGIAHAECLVLKEASRKLQMWRLEDCTLYVTKEPCAMCAGAMVNCRIPRLVFGCGDSRCGAAGGFLDVCRIPGAMQKIEVTPGCLEAECRELLQSFFRERRTRQNPGQNPGI